MGRSGFAWCIGACVMLALTCLAPPTTLGAQELRSERGEAKVRGIGIPPVGSMDLTATERLASGRTAALVNALRNAAELLHGASVTLQSADESPAGPPVTRRSEVRVRAELGGVLTVTGDAVVENRLLVKHVNVLEWSAGSDSTAPGRTEVENLILVSPPIRDLDVYALMQKLHEARVSIVKWMDHPDGHAEVVIKFAMSGDTSLGVLSKTSPAPSCPGAYSGIVVDARGLGLRLALFPRIVSADGLEIYGPAVADREAAQQRGLVGYARDLEKARTDPRLGTAPLMIKAAGVTGRGQTDAVVSDEDWLKLYALNRCSRLLDEARVVFLVE